MPQETEMDRVGKELAQQARSRIRKRKMMYEGSLTGGLPTTLTPKPSLSGLSRTAQQMLSGTTPKGADTQLRASYGLTPTPGGTTPTPLLDPNYHAHQRARLQSAKRRKSSVPARYAPTPPPSR